MVYTVLRFLSLPPFWFVIRRVTFDGATRAKGRRNVVFAPDERLTSVRENIKKIKNSSPRSNWTFLIEIEITFRRAVSSPAGEFFVSAVKTEIDPPRLIEFDARVFRLKTFRSALGCVVTRATLSSRPAATQRSVERF